MNNRKDYLSDQTVRWCPGCGDFAILATLTKVLATLNIPKHDLVFISGIGCAGRLPYYLDTYGFHGIHGRAPTIATGLKLMRPELSVWIITGDGDGLSIGTNHLVHLLRRNLDVKILLINNQIYGLTKGQFSPTSELGKVTRSSPQGTIATPLNPLQIAIASGATFAARALAVESKHLYEVLLKAAQHKGSAFVEIYQNCNVFNDGAFDHFAKLEHRSDRTLKLEHGKPLIYGSQQQLGINCQQFTPSVVEVTPEAEIACHSVDETSSGWAYFLTQLHYPDFPVPLGVFRQISKPCYEDFV